ncbi:hypothetical protein M5689_021916 [Euphorbia peplus]|nr:hypothetical protein M5689_021916 [Euphorbia peplus]
MNNLQTLMTFFILFCILALSRAQERAPHGLAYETPVAFSPAAVDFFHPKTQNNGSPLPLAAHIDENGAQQSLVSTSQKGERGLGAGGIAAIVLGFTFVVVVTMAGFYVFVQRRADGDRCNFIKPDHSSA